METSLIDLQRVKSVAPVIPNQHQGRCAVMMRALPDFNPDLEHERVDRVLVQWARSHAVQFMRSQVDLGFLLTVCGERQEDPRHLALSLQAKLHEVFGIDYFISYSACDKAGIHALTDLEKTAQAAKMLRRTDPVSAGIWKRANAVQRFRDCLSSGTLKAHAQPIVCMETLRPIGHELLARAYCPYSGEQIPTGEWIPAVVEGHDSLRLALQMLKLSSEFMDREISGYVTINVTGTDLANPDFRNALAQMSFEHRNRLVLELVESVDLLSINNIGCHLDNVRTLGCRVALDDFGTAHAKFAVLRTLQFDIIKLDIGLVHSKTQLDRALMDVLLEHAKRSRITLVAEGIESRELMDRMLERGIKIGQGFYLDSASI